MEDTKFERLLDETVQAQLGYPTESELIEILNKHEYCYGGSDLEGLRKITLIRWHLARRQGGVLDRFGLRNFTLVELEHRRQNVERDIQMLEAASSQSKQPPSLLAAILGAVDEMTAGMPIRSTDFL